MVIEKSVPTKVALCQNRIHVAVALKELEFVDSLLSISGSLGTRSVGTDHKPSPLEEALQTGHFESMVAHDGTVRSLPYHFYLTLWKHIPTCHATSPDAL